MSLLSRIANAFRPGRLDADLNEELQFHIDERKRALVAEGMTESEARSAARRQFGSPLQLRESSHDAKALVWLESILRDVRFSLRVLRKEKTVTVAAVLSLALALGVCTAAFSLLDTLLLRPLPIPRPQELVALSYPGSGRPGPSGVVEDESRFSYPLFQRLRDTSSGMDLFGATFSSSYSVVTFAGSPEELNLRVESLTGNGFAALELKPAAGRLFTSADDRIDAAPIAVLSHAFWTRHFGGSPSAIGQWMTVAGRQYQIAGVAQVGFSGLGPGYLTDAWIPFVFSARPAWLTNPEAAAVHIWGRLPEGRAFAAAQLRTVFSNFRRENANGPFHEVPLQFQSAATGEASLFRKQFRQPLWILGLISVLILAIACSNVANLLIARGAARGREMALRIAIGAGRGRLVQQLLVESALLSGAACVLALVFAGYTAPLVVSQLGPSDFPAYLDAGIDARVFGFAMVCAGLTTIAFGLIPALRASAVSPNLALQGDSTKSSSRSGTLKTVLSVQVAFSIAVLLLSGLLVTSFRKLMNVDLGFTKDRVLLFDVAARGRLDKAAQQSAAAQLLDGIRRSPGVEAAGASTLALMSGAFGPMIAPQIRLPGGDWERTRPLYMAVSPGFFETMQIRLLSGRGFDVTDTPTSTASAVIVNQAFVEQFLKGRNALGQRIEQLTDDPEPVTLTVVGIVANVHYNNLREKLAPTIYTQLAGVNGIHLAVRTAGDPHGFTASLRKMIESSGALKVTHVTTQSTTIDDAVLAERLLAILGGLFAAIALLLVTVGLYGVIRYAAARRQKEVGIRIALGAPRPAVLRLMCSDVAAPVAAGLIAGIAGGAIAARYLESILFQVRPTDAVSLAIPVVSIVSTALAAALPPALRASRIDPMSVLRHE